MSNQFYVPGTQRSKRVHDLFGLVARRYDLLNDIQSVGLHRLWKRRLVELAQVRPGDRFLDICCGTGDIALAMARNGGVVTGLDFSAAMLNMARRKAAKSFRSDLKSPSSPPRNRQPVCVEFQEGDAQNLPFPDDTFAAVTVGYGLRNLESWESGLREMHRVARPGGRVLVLDFGKPPNPLLRQLYFGYLRLAVPLFGRVFAGSATAYAYILESLRHYPAQEGVAGFMRELGLEQVEVHQLLGGMMSINRGVKSIR